eukprot:comp20119_c0_seq1/m.24830 comp20119_c0_seq1/g.24830  ORF comp20119_c0_seq1/g.24830 comp20119_c0_seq1/m.24830 type:complete len:367 (-) comp20119_c0_seq1:402-1502(-)
MPSHKAKRLRKDSTVEEESEDESAGDFIRWRHVDDMALINGMQQVGNIVQVYRATKFSRPYTLKELRERWQALLYDKTASRRSLHQLAKFDQDALLPITDLHAPLWSPQEEDVLRTVPEKPTPGLEVFESLLEEYKATLHPSRTAKKLQAHWRLLAHYGLLNRRGGKKRKRTDGEEDVREAESFTDTEVALWQRPLPEAMAEFKDTSEAKQMYRMELLGCDRLDKRKMRKLEEEVAAWAWPQGTPIVPGAGTLAFDMHTLAVLRGVKMRYLMRAQEVVLGRAGADVDLSEEGPVHKVSRRQGILKLKSNCEFYLKNIGKRPIYVNGKPLVNGERVQLNNYAIIEICELRLMFCVNHALLRKLRAAM